MTVQIGDGAALARALQLPVVHDFRAADVAAGGQGAPFVPAYHRALALMGECEAPVAIVNIGGVANITYIDGETLIACDTDPATRCLMTSCCARPVKPSIRAVWLRRRDSRMAIGSRTR